MTVRAGGPRFESLDFSDMEAVGWLADGRCKYPTLNILARLLASWIATRFLDSCS
jgi:hypothetical protein